MFQLTPRMGGDRTTDSTGSPSGFNSRPRRGATPCGRSARRSTTFQLTPPHGGRLVQTSLSSSLDSVSTHAPAWGATRSRCEVRITSCFNSRPRMGGDAGNLKTGLLVWFQLTPPHGGRRGLTNPAHPWFVSTHAPAWGATLTEGRYVITDLVSTHAPHGGRLDIHGNRHLPLSFNSRPAWGGLNSRRSTSVPFKVSTHAPHGGRPDIEQRISSIQETFQLTPPHGGRRVYGGVTASAGVVQLTPRMGGDGGDLPGRVYDAVSTHAPQGGRQG